MITMPALLLALAPICTKLRMPRVRWRPLARSIESGIFRSGFPVALAGWCHALRIYGRLDLEAILEPAVRYAERGFQVTPLLASYLHREKDNLRRFPASRAIFFQDNRSLKPKETLIQSDYGDTLYHGLLGQVVSDEMESNGGIIAAGDLGRYNLQAREPV